MLRVDRGLIEVPVREPPPDGPLVSIIVPARNEERVIERCVRSLLEQRYPSFEVIVLDDRSTDRTGQILAELARSDARLRVVGGTPLPAGWVGKCWAAQQAAAAARGSWLLFVDADTRHRPLMLASAVAFAEAHRADLLSLGPYQELGSLAERALLPAIFGVILLGGGSLAQVNDPRHPIAKANGQFMLFRADVYRRIGRHESVRDEIVEDFALARRIKGTGHRLLLVDGSDLVATRMYHSLGEIWEGFSKNAYLEARRHPAGLAIGLLVPWLVVALPPLLFSRVLRWRLRGRSLNRVQRASLIQSGAQCALLLWFSLQLTRLLRLRPPWALTVPLGLLFFGLVMANSAARVLSGRGVTWKGRRYEPGGAS